MGCKVILTPQALDDLREIVAFIAQNPARAKTFGNELIDHALTLAELPERGRVVPEISEPSVREIVHRPYRIIYEIFPGPSAVYVLRFWHGARGEPEIENQKHP
jgi:plasmid stabilization system protein ParE